MQTSLKISYETLSCIFNHSNRSRAGIWKRVRSTKNEIRTGIFINLNIYAGPILQRKHSTLRLWCVSKPIMVFYGKAGEWVKWLLKVIGLKGKKNEIHVLYPWPKFLSVTFIVLKVEIKTWVLCRGYAISDWGRSVPLRWDENVCYAVYIGVVGSQGSWVLAPCLTYLVWSWASHSACLSEMTEVGQTVYILAAWTYGYVFILRYSTPKHIRKS